MPYISQEQKKKIQADLDPIFTKYSLKGTLSIHHHSTLVLKIHSGGIDFIGNYNKVLEERNRSDYSMMKDSIQINPFWYKEHFTGDALECLKEIIQTMQQYNGVLVEDGDYGTVPHYYIEVNIGYDKPYQLISKDKAMKKSRYSGDPYWLTAKFGNCSECHKPIKGLRAFYYPNTKDIFCEECGEKHSADFQAHKQDEEFYNQQYQWGK